MDRIVMLKYSHSLMSDPENEGGMCDCEHALEPGEIVMGYPIDDFHVFVCLTCHFWNVHEEATA